MGKYIKFGLRADRSLSDLEDPKLALTNLLDDISSVVIDGAPAGFTTEDISPVFGLRNTGLADYVTVSGTANDLLQLNGSLVEYTSALQPGVNREVEPRVTIQDNINNARTILGANPWLNGGPGPKVRFIPSSRIKFTPTASTNGNSVNVSNISALGNNLYTTSTNKALFSDDIVYDASFWNNGVFELGPKIYPTFPNSYGMIQWTGYLSGKFTQRWESTGLFLLEQDTVDNGTDNNWEVLKNVYSTSITATNVSWSTSGTTATLVLGATQVKSVCSKMKVTINAVEYEVNSVDGIAGTCTILSNIGTGTGTTLTFTWSISNDVIETGDIYYEQPKIGDKIRVRYTVWWPNPVSLGLPSTTTYKTKRFAYSVLSDDRLPFTYLYPEYIRDVAPEVFSFEYFNNNKAGPLKQSSDYSLRINDTVSLVYTPPTRLHNVVRSMAINGNTVALRTFLIADGYGRLEGTGAFTGCKVGDWLTFNGTFVCQLREVRNSGLAYVDKDVLALSGFNPGQTITTGIVFENLGLIGLFRLNGLTATTGTLTTLAGSSVPLNQVYTDYICMGIKYDDGAAGFQPLRIISTSAFDSSPKNITTSTYQGGSGTVLPVSSNHICAVYASRGLEDLSSTLQCVGVYGREVKTTSTTGSFSIELTTSVGVAANDYVQYAGVIPVGARVATVNVATGVITLDAAITATLNSAATVVFIKAANYVDATNKEFCVIPLNTAPPFAGTDVGLITTSEYSNLTTVDLAFAKLDLTIPTSKITSYTTIASANRYFPVKHGNTTYKALVVV
jgi:hypothetical protein